ncbi:hypothetical protein ACFFQW_38510 [Umezawaea endophytica]|uniref:Terpene synthase n=1 Tax=Umezawaea endophytica TaxID=1654476 RepID=A0A9X2VWT5_9PSEU|nr:hypothetical protein [Umezawaea endophytica]MCS7483837.1 hypothetical protein [Umezawaea endophytica]
MWLFAVDDHCDETELSTQPTAYASLATQIHRAIEAPEAAAPSANPYVTSARDLRLRLEATGATPVQITRWTYGIRTFLFGQVRECQARATGFVPDLDEFLALRLDTTGGFPVFALNDYARGFQLPSAEANRPAVRAVTEMAVMLVGLDDEIVSFHKECHRSPDDLNIIGIIAHHDNVSVLQALTDTIAMRDRIMARFVQLSAQISRHCSHELSRYLQSLHTWVRAWMDWSYNVDRYLNPDAPADLTGGCHDNWPDHSRRGLTIPTVAWWWDISWSPS